MIRISTARLALIVTMVFVACVTLLNQRPTVAYQVALAYDLLAVLLFTLFLRPAPIAGPLSTILLVFGALSVFSTFIFYATSSSVPWEPLAGLIFSVLITMAMSRLLIHDPDGIEIVKAVLVAALFPAVFKTIENSLESEQFHGWTRQTPWGDALGALAPMVLLIRRQWLRTILVLTLLTALLISLKRSAFLVGIVIILVQVTKIRLKLNITPRTLFGGVLSIAFLIGGGVYLAQSNEIAQYFDIMSRRLENIATDKGSGRLDLWAFASDLMSESNLYYVIFGYGFGWYHQNWQNFGTGIESLHNDVMEVWLSLGLVGVICYLAFLGRIAFLSLSIAKSRPELREFALSVFPIYLIYAAVAGTFFYFYYFVPLFVAIGYLEAVRHRGRRSIPSSDELPRRRVTS